MTDRFACSTASRALGEQLAGTAALATGWVAVEHAGPWTPQAPTEAELGPVATRLVHPDVRVQLIRPVRVAHAPGDDLGGGRTVLLAHGSVHPGHRWLRRLRVTSIAELLAIDPAVTLSPTPPDLGEPVDHDVWLVCTHARRDACCALYGRSVALDLQRSGHEVWETTHTGGHRFAATAIVLPDGLSLGRLDTVDVADTADALAAGRLDPALLRGRCAVPPAAQAAEAALRERLGLDGRDDVVVSTAVGGDARGRADADVHIRLEACGVPWRAIVRIGPAHEPRPVSDTAAPTHPAQHEVIDLVPLS